MLSRNPGQRPVERKRLDRILHEAVGACTGASPTESREGSTTVLARLDDGDSVYALVRLRKLDGGDGLTPRQAEIARLASYGLSNKEIARRLTISTATVAAHLRAAYGKLGVTSRTELAREVLLSSVVEDGHGAE